MVALGKKSANENREEIYTNIVNFLESCIDLFCNMRVGNKGAFKPVQTGLMLTTKSYIELTDYLIQERGFLYVLGARFFNNFVENLFSNIRKKFPNALQFKHSLKNLTISQYLQELPNTNYNTDSDDFLVECLKRPIKTKVNE